MDSELAKARWPDHYVVCSRFATAPIAQLLLYVAKLLLNYTEHNTQLRNGAISSLSYSCGIRVYPLNGGFQ